MSDQLKNFIREQMDSRRMSGREFAKLVGVSSSTIVHHLNDEEKEPQFRFLRKLSKATGTPLAMIIGLAFPEHAAEIDIIPPEVLTLAIRLMHLPPDIRSFIMSSIAQAAAQNVAQIREDVAKKVKLDITKAGDKK